MGGMNFRKLRSFNLALLAKQGWRLPTNPDSLVGQIYKAKYHPTSIFMDATPKANPSLIWRSILAAQDILRRGARWRIGKSDRMLVWEDPWLPDMSNPRVESPLAIGLEHVMSILKTHFIPIFFLGFSSFMR